MKHFAGKDPDIPYIIRVTARRWSDIVVLRDLVR